MNVWLFCNTLTLVTQLKPMDLACLIADDKAPHSNQKLQMDHRPAVYQQTGECLHTA